MGSVERPKVSSIFFTRASSRLVLEDGFVWLNDLILLPWMTGGSTTSGTLGSESLESKSDDKVSILKLVAQLVYFLINLTIIMN